MSAEPDSAPPQRRCAVLGSPIAHSRSPALHRAAYAALGLSWRYDAIEVTAEELPDFVESLGPEWRGLSLTMPLKAAAIPLCSMVDAQAARVGAVNTLVRSDEGGWQGFNTDIGGCVDVLQNAGVARAETALIVGAGATAASALAALAELDASRVEVLARSVERAGALVSLGRGFDITVEVSELGAAATPDGPTGGNRVDVLVSTIPAAAQTTYADDLARRSSVVLDVVYDPVSTPLLVAAERAGAVGIGGLELLLRQAARQVVLMTGAAEAPIGAMHDALR